MASTTTANVAPTKYVYGSGADLASAIKSYGNNPNYSNYKFVDTSQAGFDPNSMVSDGFMLGGNKVNTNISDDLLGSKNITRLWGNDAAGTSTALANNLGAKFIYGSGNDLANARSRFGNNKGYNFVDVSDPNFNPNTMVAGSIMLGGNGVNTNITDAMLNAEGVSRLGGTNSEETADKLQQNYVNSLMPTNPEYNDFNFSGSMQDYLDQAQNMYAPQKELTESNINNEYDTNLIPQANNDTLSRGLARTSYAGNRVDQLNTARARDIANADLQLQQQINNMAMQNYNTAYDRAYQLNRDKNSYNQQSFANQLQGYNTLNDSYWKNKTYNNSNNQWQAQFDYQKQRDATSDNQWQQTFDRQGLWHDEASNGSSGGSGGSGRKSSGSSGYSSKKKSSSGSSDEDYLQNLGYNDQFIQASQPTWDYEGFWNGPVYADNGVLVDMPKYMNSR